MASRLLYTATNGMYSTSSGQCFRTPQVHALNIGSHRYFSRQRVHLSIVAARNNGNYRGGGYRGGRGGRGGRSGYQEPSIPVNDAIQASEVRVMTAQKDPLGVMSTREALQMARDEGVDLICVVPDAQPPVCRIMSLDKYNYEMSKAAKDAKKKQRESIVETKELKLRPSTDVHDYQVKVRAAEKFLSKGSRVKLTIQFKGREMEFKQIGREMFERFIEDLGGESSVSVEAGPQMQGRQMTMLVGPKKIAIEP